MKYYSYLLVCSLGLVLTLGCSATTRNAIQVQPEGSASMAGDYHVSYEKDADTGQVTVRIFDQAGNPQKLDADRLFCELTSNDGQKKIGWLDGEGFHPEITDYDYQIYPWSTGASEYSSRFNWASKGKLESVRVWIPSPDGNRYEVTLLDDGIQGKPLTANNQSSALR